MADSKISALPASTTPLAGTEVLPIVQSSTTRQVSVANLTAGRAISATQITLTTGNVIVASGQGIDFSATSHPAGMTSELLADYEEGTWTPGQGGGLVVVGTFSSSGNYIKVGTLVFVQGLIAGSTSVAASAGGEFVNGLPYAPVTNCIGTVANAGYSTLTGIRTFGGILAGIETQTATSALAFSIVYRT